MKASTIITMTQVPRAEHPTFRYRSLPVPYVVLVDYPTILSPKRDSSMNGLVAAAVNLLKDEAI